MDRISSFLTNVLQKRGLADHAKGALATLRARDWITEQLPQISSYIKVKGIKEGEIVIACENAIAMQECRSASEGLLQELRKDSSCGVVRSIRVERA